MEMDPQTKIEPGIDILGLGAVAVDELIYVESYPAANSKIRIVDRERQCGGLTATALVAAASLGCRCAYAGVTGIDEESDFALDALSKAGIQVNLARRESENRVFHSTIIVDNEGGRTLFCDGRDVQGAGDDWPEEHIIRSCKVLFVDHIGMTGMIRAARIARSSGIPIVADIERSGSELFDQLRSLVDHLIVPEELARSLTGRDDPAQAAVCLWNPSMQAAVVTCGEKGCWYLGSDCLPKHQPAYRVEVIDTTGCGDVFHGAYAAGLVSGLDLYARIRLSTAAAAIKATRRGGQAGCPTMAEVESFLSSRG